MNSKIGFFTLLGVIFIFIITSLPQAASAQTNAGEPHDSKLYKTVQHLDSLMFDAFNTHNLQVMASLFSDSVEFYHDKGGLSNYSSTIESFKRVFATTPNLRRELINGTLEVYPVPGYGAIEMGEHRFTHIENGKIIAGVFKFIHVWQYKDGAWKITRVVSVGH
jgi:Domain of unknown function (DUF4440)